VGIMKMLLLLSRCSFAFASFSPFTYFYERDGTTFFIPRPAIFFFERSLSRKWRTLSRTGAFFFSPPCPSLTLFAMRAFSSFVDLKFFPLPQTSTPFCRERFPGLRLFSTFTFPLWGRESVYVISGCFFPIFADTLECSPPSNPG